MGGHRCSTHGWDGLGRGMGVGRQSPFQFPWHLLVRETHSPFQPWALGESESILRKDRSQVRPGKGQEGSQSSEPLPGALVSQMFTAHRGGLRERLVGPTAGSSLHLSISSQNVLEKPPLCPSPSGTGKDRELIQVHTTDSPELRPDPGFLPSKLT